MSTFTFADLLGLAEQVPSVGETLRFEHLGQRGDYRQNIRKVLKAQRVELTPATINVSALRGQPLPIQDSR